MRRRQRAFQREKQRKARSLEKARYVHEGIKTPHWDKRERGMVLNRKYMGPSTQKSLQANRYSLDLNRQKYEPLPGNSCT